MTDEQKRIKAIIDEQIRLLAENPNLKGKSDAQLWGNELRSRASKAQMANPEFRQEWDEKQRVGLQQRSNNVEWREKNRIANQTRFSNPESKKNHQVAMQKLTDSIEWREKQKAGAQKNANNPEWREIMKIAGQKNANNPEWREKQKAGAQKRSDSIEWKENHRLQLEKMHSDPNIIENRRVATKKALNKPISCDGIIFPSKTEAYLTLAPATRLTNKSKKQWLDGQMKKYPERYFYIIEDDK